MSELVTVRKADIALAQRFRPTGYSDEVLAAKVFESPDVIYVEKAAYDQLCLKYSTVSEASEWFNYFDWIPVINLNRRPERWEQFVQRYRAVSDWPFRAPERYAAVDATLTGAPPWIKCGVPAWGCAQSHIQILETAIQRGYKRILVLEDDALFCSGFSQLAKTYFGELPADWHQAYIGGQHLNQKIRAPRMISPNVMRAYNVNRTHGYALNAPFFRPLYRWLVDYVAWAKIPTHHIDHHMGRLHEMQKHNIFTPKQWLVGQADGTSDITCRPVPVRFWGANAGTGTPPPALPPFVAIIGIHRSGSSMLAWILNKLGVHMGNQLNGNCEANGLLQLCERLYPFGKTTAASPVGMAQAALAAHISARSKEALHKTVLPGGKYPHLCAMRDLLIKAAPNGLRIIHIDRPLDDSIASLVTRVTADRAKGIKWLGISDEAAIQTQRWLYEQKQRYFDGTIPSEHILHLNYYDVLQHPDAEIEKIVKFLNLTPTIAQLEQAKAVVRPDKRKHGTVAG
jgi:hypothetical protein